jgi:hypothetical protein
MVLIIYFLIIIKNLLRIEINQRAECIDERKYLSPGNKLK